MKHIFFLTLLIPLLFLSCKKISKFDYKVLVTDYNGMPLDNVTVKFYNIVPDLIADTNSYLELFTNSDGQAEIPKSLASDQLVCRAELLVTYGEDHHDIYTSEFLQTIFSRDKRTYTVKVATPSREVKLCGHGSKQWKVTRVNHFGSPTSFTELIVTFNSDGTWTDDLGNTGEWEFLEDGTLVYDSPLLPGADSFYVFNATIYSMQLKKLPTQSWELFMEAL